MVSGEMRRSAQDANRRWRAQYGQLLKCPSCGGEWREEIWRKNDGPCDDGNFYCVDCLSHGRCGCRSRAWRKREDNQHRA